MKVPSDPGAAPAPTPSRSGESSATESKSFDKVLERKSEDRQGKKVRGPKIPGLEGDAKEGVGEFAAQFSPFRQADPGEVGKSGALPEIRMLDGLVREILVEAGPGVNPKVEVQFQSRTLEGLNVRIVKNGDEISIRFLTGSESVAQLLNSNKDQLSQALLAKGLHVAPIQVERTTAPPRSSDSGNSSGGEGRRGGQGDERRDKRQR
jgi:hypothetical protein